MTTTKNLGYLNLSQAIENTIWIARRAKVEKIINAQTDSHYVTIIKCYMNANVPVWALLHVFAVEQSLCYYI